MSLSTDRFNALLAKAKILAQAKRDLAGMESVTILQNAVKEEKPHEVDLRNLGISDESLETEEGEEAAIEVVSDLGGQTSLASAAPETNTSDGKKVHTTGVAADVSLNAKQRLFIETALKGEDVCLIGAAGTGKTTVTGKFTRALMDQGDIEKLGVETKYLSASSPGILITSFTRKAVNNIRRAVIPELQGNVLTMHKALEFQPVFYEIFDTKTAGMKKTMKFEPQRHSLNPLPSTITLVVYEEGSMIGMELYNLMAAALPHLPQEIFIGDIRQLPPVFGPAILGFKMALLPIVELDEVYRQALQSPIIRLAHGILSGDARKFDPEIVKVKEKHPHLDKVLERKHVPSLEAFECSDQYGTVKLQVFQNKLSAEVGCNAVIQQFVAWSKNGYYKPDEDVIICPFNKSFGTVELNKGIQQYLGQARGAVVHQVIARSETHYLAVGDRVLFDKEDAFITEIRKNVSYLGKQPMVPDVSLNRWGTYEREISQDEMIQHEMQDAEDTLAALDKFMDMGAEDEDAVNVASHAVKIKFSYSDEEMILSTVGEVNSLLGGNALTVHKMQGSENERIFFILHNSHASMVNNELLYTGCTRARKFLHVICEVDTFHAGVKRHKVRGKTMADKIKFFQGKIEFKDMQEEMELLKRVKARKAQLIVERRLERQRKHELEKLAEAVNVSEKESEHEYEHIDYTHLVPTGVWGDGWYQDMDTDTEVGEGDGADVQRPGSLTPAVPTQTANSKPTQSTGIETPLQKKVRLLREKLAGMKV